jgi:histidyl-tRNA synthetase
MRAIDKMDRLGPEGVADLLTKGRRDESGDFTPGAGLDAESAERIIQFASSARIAHGRDEDENGATLRRLQTDLARSLRGEQGVQSLCEIACALDAVGLDARDWLIDTSIIRGLEYYTGPVFEAQLYLGVEDDKVVGLGSIGGGGRYDDLVARFTGQLVAATGFSVGVSRLAAALEAAKPGEAAAQAPVVVLALDRARMGEYFAMAAELRNAGVRAEVYLGQGGMRAQMKYADKRDAPIAIIQGGDEIAKGVVTLKDLKLGAELSKEIADNVQWRKGRPAQIEAPRAALVTAVRNMLVQQGVRDA